MKTSPAYIPALKFTGRYLLLYGGAGSGKSFVTAQKVVQRAYSKPGHRILVCRKVRADIKESTYALLKEVCDIEGIPYTENQTDLTLEFPNGSQILHKGLDKEKRLKSIAGITSIWIEEATELTEQDFDQLDLRLRGASPDYRQMALTFNPENERHWLKRRFFDKTQQDALIVHTTWRDNAFTDESYGRILMSKGEDSRRVYERGEWGASSVGLIYPEWYPYGVFPTDTEDVVWGLDFGYVDPTVLVRVTRVSETDIVADQVLFRTGLTNAALIKELERLNVPASDFIYADHEPDRIEEIYQHGYNIQSAKKSILDGIDAVKRYNLHVTDRSEDMKAELYAYKWRTDREGNPTEKPIDAFNHALDATRYAVKSHFVQEATWLINS